MRGIARIVGAGLLLCALGVGTASGATVVNDDGHGQFDENGQNYGGAGNYAISGFTDNRRAWFSFDLTSLAETVSSATLTLPILDTLDVPDTFEFSVYQYLGDPNDLYVSHSFPSGLPLYQDLGDGPVYASGEINPADASVDLSLSATAVSDINSNAGGLFALGVASALVDSLERARWIDNLGQPAPATLTLEFSSSVPEPSTTLLIGVAALALRGLRSRRGTPQPDEPKRLRSRRRRGADY